MNILGFRDHQVDFLRKETELQIIGHSMCKKVYKTTKYILQKILTSVAVLVAIHLIRHNEIKIRLLYSIESRNITSHLNAVKKVILFFIFFITIAAVNITTVTTGMQLVNDVIKARQGLIDLNACRSFVFSDTQIFPP